jgi:choline dehydrogenase-like flavoprotein
MNNRSDTAGVLIAGAGLSAGVAARHLAEAGYRVICLDQGGGIEPGGNPRVRRSFGYPGTVPRRNPSAPGEAEYYLEDNVLEPVVVRGPIFRQADAKGPMDRRTKEDPA